MDLDAGTNRAKMERRRRDREGEGEWACFDGKSGMEMNHSRRKSDELMGLHSMDG